MKKNQLVKEQNKPTEEKKLKFICGRKRKFACGKKEKKCGKKGEKTRRRKRTDLQEE